MATRRSITPCASSRWMRRQHGVCDRFTRAATSATGKRGILLEDGEDLEVGAVHSALSCPNWKDLPIRRDDVGRD